jgi:hypothetical protein
MGIVDGGGLRGSRQSALKLMILNLKLFDSMFGSYRFSSNNLQN